MYVLPAPPAATPPLYAQDGKGLDATVYAHYFLPGTACDWYVTEFDFAAGEAFGWAEVVPGGGELGYFDLDSLSSIRSVPVQVHNVSTGETVRGSLPMTVELDEAWEPIALSAVLATRGR